MKILLSTVALATLLSSSADAQYGVGRGYYRAYAQVPPYAGYRFNGFNRAYAQVPPYAAYRTPGFYRAYAQAPPYAAYRSNGFYGAYAQAPYYNTPGFYDLYGRLAPYPYSVYSTRGQYIGSDPDPRVRSQLAHDPTQGME